MTENTLAVIKDEARFYISTPEKAAEALAFVKQLKDVAASIEESVKNRAYKIMSAEGLREVVYGAYTAKLIEPTEVRTYNPLSLVEALSETRTIDPWDVLTDACDHGLLTVSNTALKKYLQSHKVEGDQLAILLHDSELKTKSGYISISERSKNAN